MKNRFSIFFLLALFAFPIFLAAQLPTPATAAAERLSGHENRQQLIDQSLVKGLPFENIGPSVQSGRVSDIAVNPADPSHFYVAYASGGLWKTTNNGTTFEPLFDKEAVITTGAVAADWERNTIWLGTGEVNSSRSSYAGLGMYKSTDGGETWQHKGLAESHHIGRIVIHPDDPNTVWVAVLGHLYSPNSERGIYKTSDGGETWEKTLFVNNNAGGIELVIDSKNANHLYAATWERTRRAWNFVESGNGSGIHESTDGGSTWNLISGPYSNFPTGEGAGRIGLAHTYDGDEAMLYATIDNYFRKPKEEEDKNEGLTKEALETMNREAFAQLEDEILAAYLKDNNFPKKYAAEKVKEMVAAREIQPKDLVGFLADANRLLFDTPVKGLEVYKMTAGKNVFTKTHEGYLDGVYNSYGYYFGQIRVAPTDPNRLYVMGVPVIRSDDGGATWNGINGDNVHADHHAFWANPDRPGHLILGNDGGINISYDDGENWIKCNHPPLAQFYAIAVDMAEPYNVYGGLQDNGVWMGKHTYEASPYWQQSGHYGYESIMGGDGMQVAVDTRDNETVYTGFQFGFYFRLNTRTESQKMITPKHELGETPYRWNWQTPIHLSSHNQDILYMGSNFLHRSMNQGDDFEKISGDLTQGGQKGDVPYGTLTAIHESPLQFGLLYAGSDDGLVHVTRDGGHSWQNISTGLPQEMWVSRIQASSHDLGTVYASLNGYRWDNWTSMLFQSVDFGNTWTVIGRNILGEPVNVIKEDTENANILYVGTDHGAYVSFDKGRSFHAFSNGLPAVPVHDIVVHPRDNDILLGTHGRSLYLASATALQQMNAELMAKTIHLFDLEEQRASGRWGRFSWWGDFEPELEISFYMASGGEVEQTIMLKDGPVVYEKTLTATAGLNTVAYDYSLGENFLDEYNNFTSKDKKETQELDQAENGKWYLPAGEYIMTLRKDGQEAEQSFILK